MHEAIIIRMLLIDPISFYGMGFFIWVMQEKKESQKPSEKEKILNQNDANIGFHLVIFQSI